MVILGIATGTRVASASVHNAPDQVLFSLQRAACQLSCWNSETADLKSRSQWTPIGFKQAGMFSCPFPAQGAVLFSRTLQSNPGGSGWAKMDVHLATRLDAHWPACV